MKNKWLFSFLYHFNLNFIFIYQYSFFLLNLFESNQIYIYQCSRDKYLYKSSVFYSNYTYPKYIKLFGYFYLFICFCFLLIKLHILHHVFGLCCVVVAANKKNLKLFKKLYKEKQKDSFRSPIYLINGVKEVMKMIQHNFAQ